MPFSHALWLLAVADTPAAKAIETFGMVRDREVGLVADTPAAKAIETID